MASFYSDSLAAQGWSTQRVDGADGIMVFADKGARSAHLRHRLRPRARPRSISSLVADALSRPAIASADRVAAVSAPTEPRARLESLDVLRGVALLGVFVENAQHFFSPTYRELVARPGAGLADHAALWLIQIAFENKIYALFALSVRLWHRACRWRARVRASSRFISGAWPSCS